MWQRPCFRCLTLRAVRWRSDQLRPWQALVKRARLGLQERVLHPGPRGVDVEVGGHHVVVADESDGMAGLVQRLGVGQQAMHPRKLVSELRTGLGIPVGGVEASDEHAVRGGLQVPALRVRWIAR